MIIKNNDYPVRVVEHMKGGEGQFVIEDILKPEEMHEKGRLFARGTLMPGHSVGYHVHEGDMKICFFLSGNGTVTDDKGEMIPVGPGDVNITEDGQGHMIRNTGEKPLKYLAVILFT